MGVTYSPSTVVSGYNSNDTMNTNWTAAQTAFQDCLSRSGATAGGSNAMSADLDMGGNDIINYGSAITTQEQQFRESLYQDGDTIISMSDANYTLSEAEQRDRLLIFSGSLTAPRDVIYTASYDTPFLQGVTNLTNQTITLKKSGGTGVSIPPGEADLVTFETNTDDVLSYVDSLFMTPIRGLVTIDVGGDVGITLTTAQSLNKYIQITDTGSALTGDKALVFSSRTYQDMVIINDTEYAFTAKYSGGVGVTIPAKGRMAIWNDGSEFYEVPAHSAGKSGINAQSGTSYSFTLSDDTKDVVITNAGAITATIEPDSTTEFPIGTELEVTQGGAGAITVTAGGGVTLNGTGLSTTAQHKSIKVRKVANDTWRKVSYD